MEKISLSKPVYTIQEIACGLSRPGRKKAAARYWMHIVETRKQSDGRTYIEALSDSLRSGNSDIQSSILCRLVYGYRQILQEWQVSQAGNKRNLEDVLRYLECRGLSPDTQTVDHVRNTLRKRQSPKNLLQQAFSW